MKKAFNNFLARAKRIATTPFGLVSNVLLVGGAFLSIANLPAGLTLMYLSGFGYLISLGKVAADDHYEEQAKKYFGEEEFEVEDYVSTKTATTEVIAESTVGTNNTKETENVK